MRDHTLLTFAPVWVSRAEPGYSLPAQACSLVSSFAESSAGKLGGSLPDALK